MGDNATFAPSRTVSRFAPRQSVTVAVHDSESPFAYGIVTNISPSGACLVTATPLPTGSIVFLRISFYRQPQMFETRARVIWSREDNQDEKPETLHGLLFHGVQFYGLATQSRLHLDQLLDSPEFQLVYSPASGEFESLMSELRDDLRRLGVKVGRKTGRGR